MRKITQQLTALSPAVLSILRIVVGLLFVEHGTSKLFGFPSDQARPALVSLLGLAGVLETFVGAMVTLGLYTRLAAFLLSGEMAVAYFTAHYPHGFYPLLNHGEAAVLFCFAFFYFTFAGGGTLSLDAMQGRK